MSAPLLLKVNQLQVTLNQQVILSRLSFHVHLGDTYMIIGPNGGGKTVLLRALIGAIAHQGLMEWMPDSRIGYIPQRLHLHPQIPLTTRDFPLLKLKNRRKIPSLALELLEEVGFDPHQILDQPFVNLSIGQKQRVLLSWALLGNPNVLLFDEPTSGMDYTGEQSTFELIRRLQNQRNLTCIFVTHDLSMVLAHATQVLCLNRDRSCMGAPKQILIPEILQKFYGHSVHFFHHEHTS